MRLIIIINQTGSPKTIQIFHENDPYRAIRIEDIDTYAVTDKVPDGYKIISFKTEAATPIVLRDSQIFMRPGVAAAPSVSFWVDENVYTERFSSSILVNSLVGIEIQDAKMANIESLIQSLSGLLLK
ncbi:MAG: hypothetical protein K8I03_04735 [Ignavibacteria bacterium]|nr:hypothetical protein [Ignavibacteria bacterium]